MAIINDRSGPAYYSRGGTTKRMAQLIYDEIKKQKVDADIFDVWSDFVVAGEAVTDFVAVEEAAPAGIPMLDVLDIKHMLKTGVRLIAFITRARTPMPKSTKKYLSECEQYKNRRC